MHSGEEHPYDTWFCDPCLLPYAIIPHDVPDVSTIKTPIQATPVGFNFNSTGRPSLLATPTRRNFNSSGRPSYTPPRPGRRGLFANMRRRLLTISPRVIRRLSFSDSDSSRSQTPPSTPQAPPSTPRAPPSTPQTEQPSPQDSELSPLLQLSPELSPVSTPPKSPHNDSFDDDFFDSTKIEDYQAAVYGNRILLKEKHPWRRMYKEMVKEMRNKKKPTREYYTYRFALNPKCITPRLTKTKNHVSYALYRPRSSKKHPLPQKKKSILNLPLRL